MIKKMLWLLTFQIIVGAIFMELKIPYPQPDRDETLITKEMITGTFFDANIQGLGKAIPPFQRYNFPLDVTKATDTSIYNLSEGSVWEEGWEKLKERAYLPLFLSANDKPRKLTYTPPLTNAKDLGEIEETDIKGFPAFLANSYANNFHMGIKQWSYYEDEDDEGMVYLVSISKALVPLLKDPNMTTAEWKKAMKKDTVERGVWTEAETAYEYFTHVALIYVDVENMQVKKIGVYPIKYTPRMSSVPIADFIDNFRPDRTTTTNVEFLGMSTYKGAIYIQTREDQKVVTETAINVAPTIEKTYITTTIYKIKDEKIEVVLHEYASNPQTADLYAIGQTAYKRNLARFIITNTDTKVFIYDKKTDTYVSRDFSKELKTKYHSCFRNRVYHAETEISFNPVDMVLVTNINGYFNVYKYTGKDLVLLPNLSEQTKVNMDFFSGVLDYDYVQGTRGKGNYPLRQGFGEFDAKYKPEINLGNNVGYADHDKREGSNTDDADMLGLILKDRMHNNWNNGHIDLRGYDKYIRLYKKHRFVVARDVDNYKLRVVSY